MGATILHDVCHGAYLHEAPIAIPWICQIALRPRIEDRTSRPQYEYVRGEIDRRRRGDVGV